MLLKHPPFPKSNLFKFVLFLPSTSVSHHFNCFQPFLFSLVSKYLNTILTIRLTIKLYKSNHFTIYVSIHCFYKTLSSTRYSKNEPSLNFILEWKRIVWKKPCNYTHLFKHFHVMFNQSNIQKLECFQLKIDLLLIVWTIHTICAFTFKYILIIWVW